MKPTPYTGRRVYVVEVVAPTQEQADRCAAIIQRAADQSINALLKKPEVRQHNIGFLQIESGSAAAALKHLKSMNQPTKPKPTDEPPTAA